MAISTITKVQCFHCGEDCNESICFDNKVFCCQGCKMVYSLLNKSELCNYYALNQNPGINRRKEDRTDKFAFLDDDKIRQQLVSFTDRAQTHVTFYLPQMHCSSCLYLLENLHRIDTNIISSKVNFPKKEVAIVFSDKTSLRKTADLLTSVGYEPYISLNNIAGAKPTVSRQLIYQLGIAGFCFGNSMLLSFPEYLGLSTDQESLRFAFRIINLVLCLPVVFYCAMPFYQSAFSGLKHKYLNIDAPIVLAIIVTFGRSLFELLSNTGGGYFDSLTGIVFFMLAGRTLQNKTYQKLSFERDYTSYFPVAVTKIEKDIEKPIMLPDIRPGDTLLIHNEELIPADGILTRGKAWIDYSFVTGESIPVLREMGEILYAGGKQVGGNIELLTLKEVSQSYLTGLWGKQEDKNEKAESSFVQALSKYFTYVVFLIAGITALYWWQHDIHKLWPTVTAILIIACPCALLLSNTFTNGNILAILGRNKFYLRNAQTIENIAKVNYIIFDKTGTLTYAEDQHMEFQGTPLTPLQQKSIAAIAAQSNHPLSRAIAKKIGGQKNMPVEGFVETPGLGAQGIIFGDLYCIGSQKFVNAPACSNLASEGTKVYISKNGNLLGWYSFSNQYRENVGELLKGLNREYPVVVLSGDNENERPVLEKLIGKKGEMLFYQRPGDKLNYIASMQELGKKVMMIGDGLNDAPSLKQSDVGIAVSDGHNNFTPSSDAIIEASQLSLLHKFIRLCKANRRIVLASFALSVLYNIAGLYFAVKGNLSPIIAAILMPSSSLSILLVTFGSSYIYAKALKLK